MSNPYSMPQADLVERASDETYMPKFFALNGRIGRVRYWSYSFLAGLLIMPVMFMSIGLGVWSSMTASAGAGAGGSVLGMVVGYGVYFAVTIILARRRLQDLGQSGWLSVLAIIPLIQIGIALWLLFARGDESSNEYGLPPAPNSTGVIVVAWIVPVLIVLGGILAAISIPAYKDYTDKARAAQVQEGQ